MSKNIKELIEAAKEAGIVSELKSEGGYISFSLEAKDGGKRSYELCLDADPDGRHPSAERAMRASDAVMDLYTRLNETYNCFAVSMANIAPPTGAEFARLLGVGSDIKASEPKGEAVDRFSGEVTHMIQVVIDIFIGDSTYDTVIDNVYVTCQDNPNSPGGEKLCFFKSAGDKTFDTNETVLDKEGICLEEDKRAANTLLSHLTGKFIGRTYQGVLKALSEDKGSSLYKYLAEVAKTKPSMPVGRIEMRLRTLYLGAEKIKRFVYTLSSRDGYSQEVTLLWNKATTSLGKDVLYLITEDGRFVGVTCERPEAGAVEFKRDVILAKTPVAAEDGSYRLESRFFPKSMLTLRKCEYCPESYYASDAADKAYRAGFTLLDGSHACEACSRENMTVRRNRKRYKYKARAKRFSDGASGGLFYEYAEIGGDALVSIKKGGNAFICSHCGLYIYRNEKTQPKDIPTCEICGDFVCKECFAEMRRERSAYYISGDALKSVTFCNYCKNHETVSYDGRTLRIYPAYTDSSEREEGFVLDSATKREASSLEVCGDCGRLIFTGIKKIPDGDRCVKCGAYFGGECVKAARGRHPGGATVCEACMSTLKSPEADSLFCENLRRKAEYEYGDIRTEAVRSYIQSADYARAFLERQSGHIRGVMGIFAARRLGGAEVYLVGGIKLRLKDASLASVPDACAAELEYRLDVKVGRAVRRFIIKAQAMLSQIENGACSVDVTGERAVYGG